MQDMVETDGDARSRVQLGSASSMDENGRATCARHRQVPAPLSWQLT